MALCAAAPVSTDSAFSFQLGPLYVVDHYEPDLRVPALKSQSQRFPKRGEEVGLIDGSSGSRDRD